MPGRSMLNGRESPCLNIGILGSLKILWPSQGALHFVAAVPSDQALQPDSRLSTIADVCHELWVLRRRDISNTRNGRLIGVTP
jgi:hypothetical protein